MRTKIFKSGNSQAVRIPAEMAFADGQTELEITRSGDVLIIRPAQIAGSLREAMEILRLLPKPEPIGPIERIEVPERSWDK
jgi:antitoxin VapB